METTDNHPVDMECFKIVHQLLRHNHTSFDVRYSICYTNHTAHVLYAYLDLGGKHTGAHSFVIDDAYMH
jgi:hypothetical protein